MFWREDERFAPGWRLYFSGSRVKEVARGTEVIGECIEVDQKGQEMAGYPNLTLAGERKPEEKVIRDATGKFRQKDRPERDAQWVKDRRKEGEKKGWWLGVGRFEAGRLDGDRRRHALRADSGDGDGAGVREVKN
jgi:hypothetical protein